MVKDLNNFHAELLQVATYEAPMASEDNSFSAHNSNSAPFSKLKKPFDTAFEGLCFHMALIPAFAKSSQQVAQILI